MVVTQILKSKVSLLGSFLYLSIFLIQPFAIKIFSYFNNGFLSEVSTYSKMLLANPPEIGLYFIVAAVWLFPVFSFLIIQRLIVVEINNNSHLGKIVHNYYIHNSYLFKSFIYMFLFVFFCFMSNTILWIIVDYSNISIDHQYLARFEADNSFNYFELKNQFFTIIFRNFLFSIVCGLMSCNFSAIFLLIKDDKVKYLTAFFSWYLLITTLKINLSYLVQPFISFEYGYDVQIYTFVYYVLLTIFLVLLVNYRARVNDYV